MSKALVENVNAYCKNNKISVKKFERTCHIPNGSIQKYRDGIYKSPNLRTLQKIEEATGIPASKWISDGGVA